MTNDCIYVDPYKKNVEATEYYFVFLHKRFLSFQAKIFQTRKQPGRTTPSNPASLSLSGPAKESERERES